MTIQYKKTKQEESKKTKATCNNKKSLFFNKIKKKIKNIENWCNFSVAITWL